MSRGWWRRGRRSQALRAGETAIRWQRGGRHGFTFTAWPSCFLAMSRLILRRDSPKVARLQCR